MRTSNVFFGLFLAMLMSMFYCAWRARQEIVSDFDPFRLRMFPGFGRRPDYSVLGWRFRKLATVTQVLGILFAILWIMTKEAGH